MPQPSEDSARTRSLAIFSALFFVAAAIYAVLFVFDFALRGVGFWQNWMSSDNVSVLTNSGDILVSVLGVVITVVALTLELAATRYSPRIPTVFLKDKTNQIVLAFYVIASALFVWFNLSLHGDPLPRAMFLADVALMTLVLLSVLPYFAYVFDFVSPTRFVARVSDQARDALVRASVEFNPEARADTLSAIAQLGEIARQSVEGHDRAIAVAAISALVDVAAVSVERKGVQKPEWFEAYELLRTDEDFVAWHRDVLRRIDERRTFVELKVLRQLQALYVDVVGEDQDITHLCAIQVRRLATRAAECGDVEVTRLCVRFLNTFFRFAVNERDVRAGYNLLNEYRLLAEALLHTPEHAVAVEVAQFVQTYGQLGFQARIPFLLETAAYDLCALLEAAHDAGAPEHDALLAVLLSVDMAPDPATERDPSLRGVRKAQIKLATYYLSRGEERLARQIWTDMSSEEPSRVRSLIEEIRRTTQEEFWEISDRGTNFDWLSEARRAHLDTFAAWVPVA